MAKPTPIASRRQIESTAFPESAQGAVAAVQVQACVRPVRLTQRGHIALGAVLGCP